MPCCRRIKSSSCFSGATTDTCEPTGSHQVSSAAHDPRSLSGSCCEGSGALSLTLGAAHAAPSQPFARLPLLPRCRQTEHQNETRRESLTLTLALALTLTPTLTQAAFDYRRGPDCGLPRGAAGLARCGSVALAVNSIFLRVNSQRPSPPVSPFFFVPPDKTRPRPSLTLCIDPDPLPEKKKAVLRLAVLRCGSNGFNNEPRDSPNEPQASPAGGLRSAFKAAPIEPSIKTSSRVHTRTSGARGSKQRATVRTSRSVVVRGVGSCAAVAASGLLWSAHVPRITSE